MSYDGHRVPHFGVGVTNIPSLLVTCIEDLGSQKARRNAAFAVVVEVQSETSLVERTLTAHSYTQNP